MLQNGAANLFAIFQIYFIASEGGYWILIKVFHHCSLFYKIILFTWREEVMLVFQTTFRFKKKKTFFLLKVGEELIDQESMKVLAFLCIC